MRRKTLVASMAIALVAGLFLTGCATKEYVNEQVEASKKLTDQKISEVETDVEKNQEEISSLHKKDAELESQMSKISATAQDALARAEEAGKLAKGEFLYEVTLTDEDVKFGFDRYELSDEAKAAIDDFGAKIKQENEDVYIEIQGHTDNIGTEKYNLELGYKRAEQVMRYLNMQHGFPLHRMNVISYGEYKPLVENDSKDARAKNRRVTLVVLQ